MMGAHAGIPGDKHDSDPYAVYRQYGQRTDADRIIDAIAALRHDLDQLPERIAVAMKRAIGAK